MKKTKVIFWGLVLIATLGLNSFAAQEIKEQILSSSSGIAAELRDILQTEKEKQEEILIETEVAAYSQDIKLNEKVVVSVWCKGYTMTLPKELSDNYKIKPNYLQWFEKRDFISSDVYYAGFFTPAKKIGRRYVEFITRSPALNQGNRPLPGENTVGVSVTKAGYSPDVEFYITASFSNDKNKSGKLYLNYKLYNNKSFKKAIADLEYKHLTWGDVYGY